MRFCGFQRFSIVVVESDLKKNQRGVKLKPGARLRKRKNDLNGILQWRQVNLFNLFSAWWEARE